MGEKLSEGQQRELRRAQQAPDDPALIWGAIVALLSMGCGPEVPNRLDLRAPAAGLTNAEYDRVSDAFAGFRGPGI